MRYSDGRIIFDGVQEHFNYKALFMEYSICVRAAREEIIRLISENDALMEAFAIRGTAIPHCGTTHLLLSEEDLVLVFDALFLKEMDKLDLQKQEYLVKYIPKIKKGDVQINLDAGWFLLYAMCSKQACRDMLDEVTERKEYFELWEKSRYNSSFLEGYVPAEHVWYLRVMTGMLEKVHLEGERGPAYKLFMRILSAGYRELRRALKGKKELNNALLKEILDIQKRDQWNMLPHACQVLVLLVMAEDMGIYVCYDGEMVFLLEFLEHFQKEVIMKWQNLMSGIETDENAENPETEVPTEKADEEYDTFIEAFDQKYSSHRSLSELALSSTGENDMLLFDVMQVFGMNPRKFHGLELTEEECRDIWDAYDAWTPKLYRSMLLVAVLTKYISRLERMYIPISCESQKFQMWKEEKEKQYYDNLQRQYEARIAQLVSGKRRMEEVIAEQERHINRLQKNIEDQGETARTYKEEIQTLVSYINSMHTLSEAETDNFCSEEQELWKDWEIKKVLVIGGHINWQNKLKERFPRWQFVEAKQRTFEDSMVHGKEWVICNTEVLDHSTYYKVVSAMNKNQKLLFVHSNNMEKCIQELTMQLA